MWTPTTREQYSRTALRYETDLTDAEWAVIEPHMPRPAKLGRPPDWTFRESGLARQRPVRDHQPCLGHGRSRAGRARGKPERGDHRQPVGQDHRERRSPRL